MDFLSYRGIPMTVLQTTVHERTPIHDKSQSTYLYTKWLVSFLVTYNPGAASINNQLVPTQTQNQPGLMPVLTDNNIRAQLETPRGQLIVRSNTNFNNSLLQLTQTNTDPNSIVIQSPPLKAATVTGLPPAGAGNAPCDAKGGPFCKVNAIQFIQGERLWKIHLTFETYVYEVRNSRQAYNNLILSNRWTVTADVNWQHLTTRVYQGICTVNAALLRTAGFTPAQANFTSPNIDSIRAAFAGFTVPPGYQRTYVRVELTPDGNNAVYVVRDEQQLFNKPSDGNVPRIEVQDTGWTTHGSWGRAALQFLGNVPRPGFNPFQNPLMAIADQFQATFNAGAKAAAANLPRYSRTVVVRAWGNVLKGVPDLVNTALAVAAYRMGQRNVLIDTTTAEVHISKDTNHMATVVWTETWGIDQTFGNFAPAAFALDLAANDAIAGLGGASWQNSLLQKFEINIAPPGTAPFTLTQAPINNPPMGGQGQPANSVVGTGTTTNIAPLIAQTLEAFGAAPGAVP